MVREGLLVPYKVPLRLDTAPARLYQATPRTSPLLRACWFRAEGRHRPLSRCRLLSKER